MLLLLSILTISAVSANEDNSTNDLININDINDVEEVNVEQSGDTIALDKNADNEKSSYESEDLVAKNNENEISSTHPNYEIKIDSITVNKSENSFKYPVHISYINVQNHDFNVNIDIIDPNGKNSGYTTSYSQNNHFITITPSIVGKYTIKIKALIDTSKYTSNNPTAYITVVDPNANTNAPINTNTPSNTINDNDDYYDYDDYYEDNNPDIKTYLKAPKTKVKYKSNSYFKIKHYWYWWDDAEPIGGSKLILKVWTGKKTKTYTLTTNSKGIAKFNTKKLKLGTHKVKITFKGKGDYKAKSIFFFFLVKKATKTAKKTTTNKKSSSKYKVITTNAKYYTINKKSGKFKVTTFITDFTVGMRAPYKCIDVFLYKNGNLVKNTKYSVKYKLNGKWTGWTKYGIIATSHHRNYVYDSVNVQKIKVKVKK